QARDDVITMRGQQLHAKVGGDLKILPFAVSADPRAIEDYYRAATRVLSKPLCNSYVNHLAGSDADDDDLLDANIQVAALSRVPEIVQGIEDEADALARKWLTETHIPRRNLTDERNEEYNRLEGMSTRPERTTLTVPKAAQSDTKVRHPDGREEPLPTRKFHLLAAEDGTVPVDFDSSWELKVLDTEAAHPGFIGWYRNPNRGVKESLAVAYQPEPDQWLALRPDFIFFSRRQDGQLAVNLVDPHGHHLADALPKLRGLAKFAEQFETEFNRVESIAETHGKLRVLDLTRHSVREAIRTAHS